MSVLRVQIKTYTQTIVASQFLVPTPPTRNVYLWVWRWCTHITRPTHLSYPLRAPPQLYCFYHITRDLDIYVKLGDLISERNRKFQLNLLYQNGSLIYITFIEKCISFIIACMIWYLFTLWNLSPYHFGFTLNCFSVYEVIGNLTIDYFYQHTYYQIVCFNFLMVQNLVV